MWPTDVANAHAARGWSGKRYHVGSAAMVGAAIGDARTHDGRDWQMPAAAVWN